MLGQVAAEPEKTNWLKDALVQFAQQGISYGVNYLQAKGQQRLVTLGAQTEAARAAAAPAPAFPTGTVILAAGGAAFLAWMLLKGRK